jgi:hypothetical protein
MYLQQGSHWCSFVEKVNQKFRTVGVTRIPPTSAQVSFSFFFRRIHHVFHMYVGVVEVL